MRFLMVLCLLMFAGCPDTPDAGEKDGPCLEDQTCASGLVCVDAVCIAETDTPKEEEEPDTPGPDAGTAQNVVSDAGTPPPTPASDAGTPPAPAQDSGIVMESLDSGTHEEIECTDTCDSLEYTCGEVCGEVCGVCTGDAQCITGSCYSEAVDVSCDLCSLQVVVINKTVNNGLITAVTLAIDYQPTTTEPNPRIMDLYFKADAHAQPLTATEGAALTAASKTLSSDTVTGNSWLTTNDGHMRFLAFSAGNTNDIEAGRLLEVSFAVNPGQSGLLFSLIKREETFAPPDADAALYGQDYDAPVVIWATP
jgi:hypothetical protein